jgi:hypothetical protein
VQRTPFHENEIPDARAVVQGKFLDVEYPSGIVTTVVTHAVFHHFPDILRM